MVHFALKDSLSPDYAPRGKRVQNRWRTQRKKRNVFHLPKPKNQSFNRAALAKSFLEFFAKGVLCVALGYGVFHSYLFFTTSPLFAVSQVTFSGNHILGESTLNAWSRRIVGRNIFQLDLQSVTVMLRENPWVREVSIARKLPQNVHIHLEERIPYARIQLDKTYLMDNYAVLIEPDKGEYKHLPIITGVRLESIEPGQEIEVEGIAPGLRAMYYLNRLEFFKNDPIDRVHFTGYNKLMFSTKNRDLKIYMATDRVDEGFRAFKIVLDGIAPSNEDLEYIDLSFRDQVVFRPAGSTRTAHRAN